MSIYEVNNKPTLEKIEEFDGNDNIFYRFQMKDWEMGTKSWGMIYSSEEEARECCEDDGLTEDEAVLNGKSACFTAKELMSFSSNFDYDFRVVVLKGWDTRETGHDGEYVVDVEEIIEVWSMEDFIEMAGNLEEF